MQVSHPAFANKINLMCMIHAYICIQKHIYIYIHTYIYIYIYIQAERVRELEQRIKDLEKSAIAFLGRERSSLGDSGAKPTGPKRQSADHSATEYAGNNRRSSPRASTRPDAVDHVMWKPEGAVEGALRGQSAGKNDTTVSSSFWREGTPGVDGRYSLPPGISNISPIARGSSDSLYVTDDSNNIQHVSPRQAVPSGRNSGGIQNGMIGVGMAIEAMRSEVSARIFGV